MELHRKNPVSFRDFKVWQKSADLAVRVYAVTKIFPLPEVYGLTSQMRRAAISVSSNIAEGFKRQHKKEKKQFYIIADGSLSELESQIEISHRLEFLSDSDYGDLLELVNETGRLLIALMKSLTPRLSPYPAPLIPDPRTPPPSGRVGQSLVEVLVAIAVGAILIGGAASIMVPTLLENRQVGSVQGQTELADELATNVKAWAAGGWNNVLGIATGTANTYYLNTASSPFTAPTGTQIVVLGSTTFTRYFYATNVYRDVNGNVTTTASGNSYDPSTELITVIAKASSTVAAPTVYSFYIARSGVNTFSQMSWAGGPGQTTPLTVASATYAAATSVSVTASGTVTLTSGGGCVQ